ncbi:aminotransferase class IV [Homoserinibacter sp. GY 40078]|uniref:aminotransferase class IV n=1 Tax=Homoserinibacter sp. GY 40078 TaxID=2603275 RepID=UPI0011CABE73|nr:aminotransferase class IV [Homoserinibacter sp. GY 40078]TXK17148.1 aminotransferase class IV [Homoserinibacter sp. GY 40078]
MSAPSTVPTASVWTGSELMPREDCDVAPATIIAADSWLVENGSTRGLDLHRDRFLRAVPRETGERLDVERFWDAAIAAIPREGSWFPRVELRDQLGAPQLLARMREAPTRHRSLILTTHTGSDPRTAPEVKGPDLAAMTRLRTEAQTRGADEAVIVTPEGWVVEGTTTCLVWWAGETLCIPDRSLARIHSVTERTVVTLATALGIEIAELRVRPEELDGCEVWALNALHGIRIATAWQGGPLSTAEEPGRLSRWSLRLDALRRPLPDTVEATEATE